MRKLETLVFFGGNGNSCQLTHKYAILSENQSQFLLPEGATIRRMDGSAVSFFEAKVTDTDYIRDSNGDDHFGLIVSSWDSGDNSYVSMIVHDSEHQRDSTYTFTNPSLKGSTHLMISRYTFQTVKGETIFFTWERPCQWLLKGLINPLTNSFSVILEALFNQLLWVEDLNNVKVLFSVNSPRYNYRNRTFGRGETMAMAAAPSAIKKEDVDEKVLSDDFYYINAPQYFAKSSPSKYSIVAATYPMIIDDPYDKTSPITFSHTVNSGKIIDVITNFKIGMKIPSLEVDILNKEMVVVNTIKTPSYEERETISINTSTLKQRILYTYSELDVKDEVRQKGSTLGADQIYVNTPRESTGRKILISNIRFTGDQSEISKHPLRLVIKGFSRETITQVTPPSTQVEVVDGDYHFYISMASPVNVTITTSFISS